MRRQAKVDANQAEIVRALRQFGATVQSLATVGEGTPDLLVGYCGANYCFEVKDSNQPPSKRKLTRDEQTWHANWRGTVWIVESPQDAIKIIQQATY